MQNKANIKQLLANVNEAQTSFQQWRADSWEDWEFRDGRQWSSIDTESLKKKGIKAITINRIFPIINLIHGHYLNNRQDIVSKGRTKQDNELGQVMSEGIQFVLDQNMGHQRMGNAFHQQIISGFGCLGVGFNSDPRKEKVAIRSHNWYSTWWDPYGTPWMQKDECRYVFTAEWTDLDSLIALFPEKKQDLTEQFAKLSTDYFVPDVYDEGQQIEEYKRFLSSGHWVNEKRRRVRPVEMWYTQLVKTWFAIMRNGQVIDLDAIEDPRKQYQIIQQAKEAVGANVKKIRVATFVSDLLLQDCPSPYVHDEYPFVPYVGYLDRFDFPFGIPRQIKEQDMEVNKRRSMALSLISSRRVKMEKGAVEDENAAAAEANRQDGVVVVKKGKMNAFEIQEMAQLSTPQIEMLMQSEREIKEISGANDESLGYSSKVQSGVALERKTQNSATITASLLENAKFSQKLLGQKITALIQNCWTEEKVLRVTDRVTGAEKFVAINEQIKTETGIEVRNNITQAIFDTVIASRPMTDTMREKNMELIFSAINKSPPEAVGPLLNLALEISDIPNKDLLLQQVRKVTGVNPLDDDLTQIEREEKAKVEAEDQAREMEDAKAKETQEFNLESDKTAAETEKLRAEAQEALAKADAAKQDVDQKGFQIGTQAAQMMKNDPQEAKPKPKDNNAVPQQKKN